MSEITAKDIIKLIRYGKKNRLVSIECGDLKLQFSDKEDPVQLPLAPQILQPEAYQESLPDYDEELYAELLNVTDPLAFEQQVIGVSHYGKA